MIPIKTPEEIKVMAEGGKILARIMKELEKKIRPGAITQELNRLAESLILSHGGRPSFKSYEGFPATLCVSVNNVIVHGLPSAKPLAEGNIVSLDIGVFYKGFHADMARTFPVGRISPLAKKLIKVTRQAFEMALKEIKPGQHFGDIEWATQNYVESQGFNVVRQLCGHGIGHQLHEDPQILNYGKRGTGPELVEGMVFCIEPMVTVGHWKLKLSPDGFGYEAVDGSLTCHFEDMVAVTKNGHQILTEF
ncbi:MAG: type I methionyl aminopeptidase [Candidatus Wildermuthbacteria bacterium GWA2_46_15]|uniref:Methionine aminopeptidase n=1 Tax=Candidatus Wildermuthbacteria bacterium GWA2_46_15 TaxID=1802443 RepID=A0A1G2QQD7_9BACT|nr:MAG: type I methionyl aminopeptidase [Candidatus Wildermuthbacteria bacterium GWA2_46_15]